MARGINKVIIIGNLGAAPDVRVTANGSTVTNLSVATNESWKGKDGKMQERTEWHRVVLFGRLAEVARDYLYKGSTVYIEGKIQNRKYTDQQGNDRFITEIVGGQMNMLGSNNSSASINQAGTQSNSDEDIGEDKEIPWDVPDNEPADWLDPDKLPF